MGSRAIRAAWCIGLALWTRTGRGADIEDLAAPKPAVPPREGGAGAPGDAALEEKREERRRRDRALEPPPAPYIEKRQAGLLKDTLTPRQRRLLLELSMVAGAVDTRGARSGYTVDPNAHFGAIWRHGGRVKDGRTGVWYGLRVAPFTGTGYHEKRPGAYGLTYFGPMVGIGKIDPVPEDDGKPRATSASGELDIPAANGWLFATGLAAVSKLSRSENTDQGDPTSDFVAKGATFDATGAWLETRYLRVLYGGLGFNVLAGAQTGREKLFVYGGVGVGFWD